MGALSSAGKVSALTTGENPAASCWLKHKPVRRAPLTQLPARERVQGARAAAQGMTSTSQLGDDQQKVHDSVKEYYGKVLSKTEDLRTSACCTAKPPPQDVRTILSRLPDEVVSKYYGCGSPLPQGIKGLRVLDLGSGSGRDCYVCAALVGPEGSVTGVDMTAEQLDVARRHAEQYCTATLGYPASNMRFVEGQIEFLDRAGLEDESVDLVISNCVINLSPDKARVLREVYRVLAEGGEMYFSDVYCDRRLPAEIRTHPVLLGECLGGALYLQDFLRLCREAGFMDPRQLSMEPIQVHDAELRDLLGDAQFYSITFRLFKLAPGRMETLCEDYGQAARYKGTLPGSRHSYTLDDHHTFQTGKWYEVCGNTASMVGETWLGPHFEVMGDRRTHYGLFDCSGAAPAPAQEGAAGAACAPGGACC